MNMKKGLKLGRRIARRSARVKLRMRADSKSNGKEEIVAALAAQAFASMRRGYEANVDVGRTFNKIKSILGHGRWKAYFHKTFAPCGIILRTAQNYMVLARKADADLKNENSSFSQTASDPHAQAMRRTNEKAQAEVAIATAQSPTLKQERVRPDCIYKLPLVLTVREQDATEKLRKSPDWPSAEKKIVSLLKVLCAQCGGK
jgi:hypothetical protein